MEPEQNEGGKLKKILVGVALLLVMFALGVGIYFFFFRTQADGTNTSGGSFFGLLGSDAPRDQGSTVLPVNGISGGGGNTGTIPMFMQLADFPVAGATSVFHDGKTYVRFVARENAHVYEVDPSTGNRVQLTNTTIPRIQEAYWGNGGSTVILRYLARDLTQNESIKTFIADIGTSPGSSDGLGSLNGSFLPDNVSAVSVSPNGAQLFYLVPTSSGVSGTIVTLSTRSAREVFRNPFHEWLPELLNDGRVVLTTKPSADVPGYSYLYDPTTKLLTRTLREKNGLTTLANADASHVLFGENISGNTALGVYSPRGFTLDEGQRVESTGIAIAAIPEKCAWGANRVRVFCGSFSSAPRGRAVPDDWYQGLFSFSDTFWTADTNSAAIALLADPQTEVKRQFDVMSPFIAPMDEYFFFTDKKDLSLWSMRIPKEKYAGNDYDPSSVLPPLTPDELKDAQGSGATGDIIPNPAP